MTLLFCILTLFFANVLRGVDEYSSLQDIKITIDLVHPRKITDFSQTMGGCLDGHEKNSVAFDHTPECLRVGSDKKRDVSWIHSVKNSAISAMRSSGLKPVAYRLRTELGVESWHWNPSGSWSDPLHHQGYWTSCAQSKIPITRSYGYRLPRRGNTLDEANNDSYSRLDDGNENTFWKSNPYLTSHYTGELDSRHPQWVIIDFGKSVFINAARLHWKHPYAKKYRIQYSRGGDLYFGHGGAWHDFPNGKCLNSCGGSPILDLGMPHNFGGQAFPVQYVRILMTESSYTAMPGSHDPRDYMGYALGEIELGYLTRIFHADGDEEVAKADGVRQASILTSNSMSIYRSSHNIILTKHLSALPISAVDHDEISGLRSHTFYDQIIHCPNQKQTLLYVSSTDPWHRACDQDERTQQPGIDRVAQFALSNHQPILWSVPILYDTPANALAEVEFLKKRGYLSPGQRLELGEEPDGQRVDPKDVAELYAQVSKKIHHFFPDLSLGGLSFVTIDVNPGDLIYRVDKRPWLKRFFKQLRQKGEKKNFQFLSFEWYPFDDLLLPAVPLLIKQPRRLEQAYKGIYHGGIPRTMPLIMSEYGYSVFSGEPEVTLSAALLQADIAAQFLLLGGTTSYLYGYEPNTLECGYGNSWGNLMMLHADKRNQDHLEPLPTYYSSQLLTQHWGPTSGGVCDLYPVNIRTKTKDQDANVTGYFLSTGVFHASGTKEIAKASRHNQYEISGLAPAQEEEHHALLLVNKHPSYVSSLTCALNTASCFFPHKRAETKKLTKKLSGLWRCYCYSPSQYEWHAQGAKGYALRNEPPSKSSYLAEIKYRSGTTFLEFQKNHQPISLPPSSITLLCK